MKYLFLLSLVVLSSCVGAPIKAPWTLGLVGQEGYPAHNPKITDYPGKGWALKSEFDPCKPSKIEQVISAGGGEALLLNQNSKLFYSQGASYFIREHKTTNGESKEKFLAPSLPGNNRTVNIEGKKQKTWDLICKGQVFTGMNEDEFRFVVGLPEKINRTTMAGLVSEQWIYQKPGGNQFEKTYYYFKNSILTSWQD